MLRFFISAGLALLLGFTSQAQGITVSPLRLTVPEGGGVTALTLGSSQSKPVTVQVRVMDWSQSDGEDVYAPAEDVVFTPEIFTLEAGQEQVVRILMPAGSETDAWRIFVDELPATSSGDAPIASQLSMRMQYILPMFAMSPEETPTPIFSLNADEDPGKCEIEIANSGNGYLRLHGIAVLDETDTPMPVRPALAYILPSSTLDLTVASDCANARQIQFAIDGASGTARLE